MNWPDYRAGMLAHYERFKGYGAIDPGIVHLCDTLNRYEFLATYDSCEGHRPKDQEVCPTCCRQSTYSARVLCRVDQAYLCALVEHFPALADRINISYFGTPENGGRHGLLLGFYINRDKISIEEATVLIDETLARVIR